MSVKKKVVKRKAAKRTPTRRMVNIAAFDALRLVGRQMSNVCYNLGQRDSSEALTEINKATMRNLAREWDVVCRSFPN